MARLEEMRFAIASEVVFEVVDGEAVLVHLHKGVYYGLNTTGTRIWQLLQKYDRFFVLRQQLLEEFDADSEKVTADLNVILTDLLENGLIVELG